MLWTLNGKLIANSTLSAFSSSLEIVNFNLSDAGIYQCIFTDTDVDSEIVTSTPFRVDTGTTAVLIIEDYCVRNSLSVHNVSVGLTVMHYLTIIEQKMCFKNTRVANTIVNTTL